MTYEEYLHFLLDVDKMVIKNYNAIREVAGKNNHNLKMLTNIQCYVNADNWDNFARDIEDKIMYVTDRKNKVVAAYNAMSGLDS